MSGYYEALKLPVKWYSINWMCIRIGCKCKLQTLGNKFKTKLKKKYNWYTKKGDYIKCAIKTTKGRKSVADKNKNKEQGHQTEKRFSFVEAERLF